MGRESRKTALPPIGKAAKVRHSKMDRMALADPSVYMALNARKTPPIMKHKSYFEIAENADRKAKKLETEVMTRRTPPPGCQFIALGNPELTALCKDISREQEAMIFIVSDSKDTSVSGQLHRLGYHFRENIVDQARERLIASGALKPERTSTSKLPESIPEDRNKIIREADAVLRDLFPRIPNTDRAEILRHSFDKDNKLFNGKVKVGLAADLSLARRVQLAALSHIRHTMTRYDTLLKEVEWQDARKAVEQPCLDVIAKWRGDEETGRDQLDEILREVIEISDNEDSDEESTEEEPIHAIPGVANHVGTTSGFLHVQPRVEEATALPGNQPAQGPGPGPSVISAASPAPPRKLTRKEQRAAKHSQQRFKRYHQVAESMRQNPQSPRSPRGRHVSAGLPQMLAAPATRQPEFLQGMERPIPVSHPAALPGPYTYQEIPPVATRPRGQSPIFVRAADSTVPKVGYIGSRPANSPHPMSPVRSQFQDLLVRSIEPQSPGVSNGRDHATSFPFPSDMGRVAGAPRVVSRPVVSRPGGQITSSVVATPDGMPMGRQQVIPQFPEQSELFSGAGFIQVHREPNRQAVHQSDAGDLRGSYAVPVSRSHGRRSRSRSPASHLRSGSYRDEGRVIYRSRPTTVYVEGPPPNSRDDFAHRPREHPLVVDANGRDEFAHRSREHPIVIDTNGRDEFAHRSREHPIVIDGPRIASRVTDAQRPFGDMEYDPRRPGEVDFPRRVPAREPNRPPDRHEVIYVNDYPSRPSRLLEQPLDRRHPHTVPVGSHMERTAGGSSYGIEHFPPRQTSYMPPEVPGSHDARGRETIRYAPVENTMPPQVRRVPQHPNELEYERQRPYDRIIVRDPSRDQAFVQQAYPVAEQPYRPVPNHY